MTGRGLAGRRRAQGVLLVALLVDALPLLLLLGSPNTMGGHTGSTPDSWPALGWLIIGAGVTLNVVGLAWMTRILRADPEGRVSSSRSVRSR